MWRMYVVGIDLSGPSNPADTAMVNFLMDKHRLSICETVAGASDQAIIGKITDLASEDEVIAGLDSPLFYNIGGGDRPGDCRLRSAIVGVWSRSALWHSDATNYESHGLPDAPWSISSSSDNRHQAVHSQNRRSPSR